MKEETARIYRERIAAVLEHVLGHLDEPLGLEALAVVAMFSPFHFHRVFRGQVGESVGEMLRRLKLERAGRILIESERQIVSIALEAGYESHESFTRAFRTAFGESPSRFRQLRKSVPPLPAPSGVHYSPDGKLQGFVPVSQRRMIMQAKICQVAERKIFCVRHVGPYNEIKDTFGKLYGFLMSQLDPARVGRLECLGLYHDDPENTPPAELRSDAGVTLPAGESLGIDLGKLPEGFREDVIPAGEYATTRHKGPYEKLGATWQELIGVWMPANGYKVGQGYCFEIYLNDPQQTAPEELLTDLHEPIVPV